MGWLGRFLGGLKPPKPPLGAATEFGDLVKEFCDIRVDCDARLIFGSTSAGWVNNSQYYCELDIFTVVLANAFGANISTES